MHLRRSERTDGGGERQQAQEGEFLYFTAKSLRISKSITPSVCSQQDGDDPPRLNLSSLHFISSLKFSVRWKLLIRHSMRLPSGFLQFTLK